MTMTDVQVPCPLFLPFSWTTATDRVKTIASLKAFKTANRPVPVVLGLILSKSSEAELRELFEETCKHSSPSGPPERLQESLDALEILSFFHHLNCRPGPGVCLGAYIAVAHRQILRELHGVKS
jgi:hypothetical protein